MAPGKLDKKQAPVGTPNKGKPTKPPGGSPPSGRKSKAEILKTKGTLAGWYLKSALLQGGIELITITTQTMADDAFFQNLVNRINEGHEEESIDKIGLLGAFFMRISLTNSNRLMNSKTNYQRRAFIRAIDDGEEGADSRLAALKVVQKFLQDITNNQYKTHVFILEPGWDMTAGLEELPKVDNYLQYSEIVKIIKRMFDNVNNTWATENLHAAECYFTEGHIPFEAIRDLGFPQNKVSPQVPIPEQPGRQGSV